MIGITVIGSGSKGNASLLELENRLFLLDAGLSCKKITDFLNVKGLKLTDLSGVFLTHEHNDHISGLRVLLKKVNLPVFLTRGTYDYLTIKGYNLKDARIITSLSPFYLDNGVMCKPFEISHDAAEPVGFRFEYKNKVLAIATDIGCITETLLQNLQGADLLCIESNYDEEMLKWCSYPGWLKRRIKSNVGHLANEGVRGILSRFEKAPEIILLMHVSQESNTNALVRNNIDRFIQNSNSKFLNCLIYIASQTDYGPRLIVNGNYNANLLKKHFISENENINYNGLRAV